MKKLVAIISGAVIWIMAILIALLMMRQEKMANKSE